MTIECLGFVGGHDPALVDLAERLVGGGVFRSSVRYAIDVKDDDPEKVARASVSWFWSAKVEPNLARFANAANPRASLASALRHSVPEFAAIEGADAWTNDDGAGVTVIREIPYSVPAVGDWILACKIADSTFSIVAVSEGAIEQNKGEQIVTLRN